MDSFNRILPKFLPLQPHKILAFSKAKKNFLFQGSKCCPKNQDSDSGSESPGWWQWISARVQQLNVIFALCFSHLCHFQGFVVAQGQQSDPKVPRIPIPVIGFHEIQIQKSLSCEFILLHLKILCFKGIKAAFKNLFSLQSKIPHLLTRLERWSQLAASGSAILFGKDQACAVCRAPLWIWDNPYKQLTPWITPKKGGDFKIKRVHIDFFFP